MATSRYLQPRQPGGKKSISSNPADPQQGDPNGVYIPGRKGRMDARPRNALYLPGTGPGTGRTGIRTGIVNRDGTTSPVSSMGYATGPLSQSRPSSLPDPNNPGASTATTRASNTRAPASNTQGADTPDSDTSHTRAPSSSTPKNRVLNPNAPLVYNPISLDNPGGSFVLPGPTIADSSYMPDESDNAAPQNNGNDAPRKRIDARPRNNIYMPGTGPGTGRTAIRTHTINRDGSTSPVSSMGYATGPLSQSRPSSLPDTTPKTTPAAPGTTAATPGLSDTLKSSTRQFGSNGEQNLKPIAPLTPAVIPSTIDLPSSSTPTIAPNAITSGVSGSIKASTTPFGSQPGTPPRAPAPAAKTLSSDLDTLKTSTPPLGTTPPLNTKAPALSLTSSLGVPTPKPSTGLDTIGTSSSKPFGSSTSLSGPLDLSGVKKRAMGGPVRAGRPYLVGEEGPELIVPKQSGTVVPNHALSYQPLDKTPAQSPSPAGGYTAEPADNDEARTPAYDATFDEPHDFDADDDEVAADTAPSMEPTSPSADRPTTGLMLRPRPMPPEYEQQQMQARSGKPSSSQSFGGDRNATATPDGPPATQPLNDNDHSPGMPWDNRPPKTSSNTTPFSASRWLQKREAPGARVMQAATGGGSRQQGGMQTFQAAAQPGADTHHSTVKSSANAVPSTTIRIGNYPGFEKDNPDQKAIDEWNTAFRNTYGTLAADAARKNGVPARLLAALSANEVGAKNWTSLNAFADRNTLLTKSVGPLQIASKTALRYKLVPTDNAFYGASKADRWTALHDPDVRHGQPAPPSGLTPDQLLSYHSDNPYPNNPNSTKIVHDYLDNPTTSFDAGAKLLKIYLQRLGDDYKSGAYLKYSKGFRGLIGLSSPDSPIHKDLKILASGDKEAIHNLHFSPNLARALAMMWNNGEDIVNIENFNADAPNAYKHGQNMQWQQVNQDDLIPAPGSPGPIPNPVHPPLP